MKKYILYFLLFNLIIVIPSFRFLLKFTNLYILIFYFLFSNGFFFFYIKKGLRFSILTKKLWLIPLLILPIVSYFVFPIVDARKSMENKGSTGDDAMILAAESFREYGEMYGQMINDWTPISPGPGWVLLNSPLVYLNCFYLITPLYLALLLFVLWKSKESNNLMNEVFIFIALGAVFWELLLNGHDIPALSFSFFILTYLFLRKVDKIADWKFILLSILLGFVCTSRVVFMVFPFIWLFIGWKQNQRNSLLAFVISIVVASGLHLVFYQQSPNYQPFHLLGKAELILGKYLLVVFALVFIFGMFKFLVTSKIRQSIIRIALVLSAILVPISYADWVRVDFDFSLWEGANYVLPLVPFYVYYLVKEKEQQKNLI